MKCETCEMRMKKGICPKCGEGIYEATPPYIPLLMKIRLFLTPYFIQHFVNYVKWELKARSK